MYTRPIFLTRQAFNCFDAVPCTGLLQEILFAEHFAGAMF